MGYLLAAKKLSDKAVRKQQAEDRLRRQQEVAKQRQQRHVLTQQINRQQHHILNHSYGKHSTDSSSDNHLAVNYNTNFHQHAQQRHSSPQSHNRRHHQAARQPRRSAPDAQPFEQQTFERRDRRVGINSVSVRRSNPLFEQAEDSWRLG